MTWLVMVSWDSTEVVSHCLSHVPGWGSVTLTHLLTCHLLRVPTTLHEKVEVDL